MAQLTFLGTGSATDFEMGQTSLIYRGSATILIDCGPQTPVAFTRTRPDPDALDAVYITHRHGDHCFGIGALLLWLRLARREKPLTLAAESGTLEYLKQLLDIGYSGAFLPSKCFPIKYVGFSANEPLCVSSTFLSIAETAHNVPNCALRIEDSGLLTAISGDGLVTAQTSKLYEGCDYIVQECAYFTHDHPNHMNVERVVAVAEALSPKHLMVTHCIAEERAYVERALTERLGAMVTFPRAGDQVRLSD